MPPQGTRRRRWQPVQSGVQMRTCPCQYINVHTDTDLIAGAGTVTSDTTAVLVARPSLLQDERGPAPGSAQA